MPSTFFGPYLKLDSENKPESWFVYEITDSKDLKFYTKGLNNGDRYHEVESLDQLKEFNVIDIQVNNKHYRFEYDIDKKQYYKYFNHPAFGWRVEISEKIKGVDESKQKILSKIKIPEVTKTEYFGDMSRIADEINPSSFLAAEEVDAHTAAAVGPSSIHSFDIPDPAEIIDLSFDSLIEELEKEDREILNTLNVRNEWPFKDKKFNKYEVLYALMTVLVYNESEKRETILALFNDINAQDWESNFNTKLNDENQVELDTWVTSFRHQYVNSGDIVKSNHLQDAFYINSSPITIHKLLVKVYDKLSPNHKPRLKEFTLTRDGAQTVGEWKAKQALVVVRAEENAAALLAAQWIRETIEDLGRARAIEEVGRYEQAQQGVPLNQSQPHFFARNKYSKAAAIGAAIGAGAGAGISGLVIGIIALKNAALLSIGIIGICTPAGAIAIIALACGIIGAIAGLLYNKFKNTNQAQAPGLNP